MANRFDQWQELNSLSRYITKLLIIICGCNFLVADATAQMVRLDYKGHTQYGKPLSYNSQKLTILSRDGSVHQFPTTKISKLKELPNKFTPVSQADLQSALQSEYGHQFQYTGTGHYLVVSKKGSSTRWAKRFEEIYRSVHTFVAARGFKAHDAEFPLVAVVLPNRTEFERHARKLNFQPPKGVVGFYDPMSNRVLLYDRGNAWSENATTIIHEAAHQAAHNVGLHSRFVENPLWVLEGFAVMFEAPGIHSPMKHRDFASRVNATHAKLFLEHFSKKENAGWLPKLISSDQLFKTNPRLAYSAAWTVSFYLNEKKTDSYYRYLKMLATIKPGTSYHNAIRLRDFQEFFDRDDSNLKQLESQIMRFAEKL